jgi:hypothetical protein
MQPGHRKHPTGSPRCLSTSSLGLEHVDPLGLEPETMRALGYRRWTCSLPSSLPSADRRFNAPRRRRCATARATREARDFESLLDQLERDVAV